MAHSKEERMALATRQGPIKRVHVDKNLIKQDKPAITIQTSKGSLKAFHVNICGPSVVTHQPDNPLSCGARLWVETRARLEIYGD